MKISIIVACLFVYTTCLAWQNTITHLDLSGAAAMISVIDHSLLDKEYSYKGELKNLLFWLEEGSKLEDAGSIYSPVSFTTSVFFTMLSVLSAMIILGG